jgi:hypothetical protein
VSEEWRKERPNEKEYEAAIDLWRNQRFN